jgi:chitinase
MLNAYWMGFQPDGNTLDQTPTYYDTATLFVAAPSASGGIDTGYFTKAYPLSQILSWSKQLQARGTQVLVSFMDTPTTHWNNVDLAAFAQSVQQTVIGEWGMNGVDIDLESGMPSSVWASTFTALIQQLRSTLGPASGANAKLSVAAYRPSLEMPILKAAGQSLNWLNTMAYFADTSGNQQLFNTYKPLVPYVNIGIGIDYQSGQSTPLSEVAQLSQFAAKQGGGMMAFAANNDCPKYSGQPQWTWSNTINESYHP